jgi:hypothetical protein
MIFFGDPIDIQISRKKKNGKSKRREHIRLDKGDKSAEEGHGLVKQGYPLRITMK